MTKLKFGIANKCVVCGSLTKNVEWIKGKQQAVCSGCYNPGLKEALEKNSVEI